MYYVLMLLVAVTFFISVSRALSLDPRDIRTGLVVCDDTSLGWYFNDQDITKPFDGWWLATFSHAEKEGGPGERAYTTYSRENGANGTWSTIQPVEQSMELASHGSFLIKHPNTSRVFVVYNYNRDNVTCTPNGKPITSRTDMLGAGLFMRYSDDGGVTWSSNRTMIPIRVTEIDRSNPWKGKVLLMHCDGPPLVVGSRVYVPLTKMSTCCGETKPSESWLLVSDDLLSLDDPSVATWRTLPDGEKGLGPPDSRARLAEENRLVLVSSPQRLLMTFRTEAGMIGAGYSDDGGASWGNGSFWLLYNQSDPNSRPLRNPVTCVTPFGTSNGKFVFVFYNNAHPDYRNRWTVWITGGFRDGDGVVQWSQPEILLFDLDQSAQGPGYISFHEDRHGLWFIETQKHGWERLHLVNSSVLGFLWSQSEVSTVAPGALVDQKVPAGGFNLPGPSLGSLGNGAGFTVALWVKSSGVPSNSLILDASSESLGKMQGFRVTASGSADMELSFGDGSHGSEQSTDPSCAVSLWNGDPHHVAWVVDGGPKVVSVVVDGVLCDGGTHALQGWSYFDQSMGTVTSGGYRIRSPSNGTGLISMRLYGRALLTSELIGNWRAGT